MDRKLLISFVVAVVLVLVVTTILSSEYRAPTYSPPKALQGELSPKYPNGTYLNLEFSNISGVKEVFLVLNGTKYENSSPVLLLHGQGSVILCTTFNPDIGNGTYLVQLVFQDGASYSYKVMYIDNQ